MWCGPATNDCPGLGRTGRGGGTIWVEGERRDVEVNVEKGAALLLSLRSASVFPSWDTTEASEWMGGGFRVYTAGVAGVVGGDAAPFHTFRARARAVGRSRHASCVFLGRKQLSRLRSSPLLYVVGSSWVDFREFFSRLGCLVVTFSVACFGRYDMFLKEPIRLVSIAFSTCGEWIYTGSAWWPVWLRGGVSQT